MFELRQDKMEKLMKENDEFLRYGAVRCGMVWCGVVLYDVVVSCGVVWYCVVL